MMDTRHYSFVQSHRMYSTESELEGKAGTLVVLEAAGEQLPLNCNVI